MRGAGGAVLAGPGVCDPSPAALGRIGQAYVRAIERFAAKNRIPVVHFAKGVSKEEVAGRYMQAAEREGRFGVVMIGIAQEKATAWRGFRRGGSDARPHYVYRRMSVFPNVASADPTRRSLPEQPALDHRRRLIKRVGKPRDDLCNVRPIELAIPSDPL